MTDEQEPAIGRWRARSRGALIGLSALGLLASVGCGDSDTDAATVAGPGGSSAGGTGGESASAGGGGSTGGQGGGPSSLCGNGEEDADEDCDDGNLKSHDGCSSGCSTEVADWRRLNPSASPTIRADHAMAYDGTRDRLVFFGGYFMGALDSTWEFDGSTWTAAGPVTVPGPRYDHRVSFLSGSGSMLMYGGVETGIAGLAETWLFSGSDWGLVNGTSPPGARYQHGMVFDSDRSMVVLFGGTEQGASLGDTWEFDVGSTTWTDASATTPPTARFGHALAYDEDNDVVVLFGGFDGTTLYNDTYTYDGATATWTAAAPATPPPARRFHHMVYDTNRDVVVLFGGFDGEELRDTWEFANGEWVETTTMSTAPRGGPMAYDSLRSRIVLSNVPAGGPDVETWAYELTSLWPDETCTSSEDTDSDGLAACEDPDCEGLPCESGSCNGGTCQ